jgi:hypothetical protein
VNVNDVKNFLIMNSTNEIQCNLIEDLKKEKATFQLNKKNKVNKLLYKYCRPKFYLNQWKEGVFDYHRNRTRKI